MGPIGGPIMGPIGGPIGGPIEGPIWGPIGGPKVQSGAQIWGLIELPNQRDPIGGARSGA